MSDGPTVKWNGTTIHPRTSATYADRLLTGQDWGVVGVERETDDVAYGYGQIERSYSPTAQRTVAFEMLSFCGSEANAWEEYQELQDLVRPSRAPVTLTREYTDGGGTVSQTLTVRAIGVPSMSWLTDGRPRFVGPESAGVLRTPIVAQTTEVPFFAGSEESDTVSLSTSKQTKGITNGGHWPIGVKFVLSSLVGTWTSILITNTTTGPQSESGGTVTWADTTFANTDYLDWRHDDWKYVDWSDGNTISNPGTASLVLWPGSNNIEVTGTGGTSGTVTIYWTELYF